MGAVAMKIQVLANPEAVAEEAARVIAAEALAVVAARGRFIVAFSRPSLQMLHALATKSTPWERVEAAQVDERVAPAGDAERNLTILTEHLAGEALLPAGHLHAMPVEEKDLEAAAASYARLLRQLAGSPPVLDLVHLGLGVDGHTASLVPGDPVLDITGQDVALTRVYHDRRRMTLTYPILNRSRRILWVAFGSEKAEMLARLWNGDTSIPAGRIRRNAALILTDRAAAGKTTAG